MDESLYIKKYASLAVLEMHKYKIVERAFHKIKGSTGLSDSKEIVLKFIGKEETYNKLLVSIA